MRCQQPQSAISIFYLITLFSGLFVGAVLLKNRILLSNSYQFDLIFPPLLVSAHIHIISFPVLIH